MKANSFWISIFILSIITACSAAPTPEEPVIRIVTSTPILKVITSSPTPTNTITPTKTPSPTKTPKPTATATELPLPFEISGSGTKVVDVEKNWHGPMLVYSKFTSYDHHALWNYTKDGRRIDLLVNRVGPYEGMRLADILENDETKRFQVKGSGEWTIKIYPLSIDYLDVLVLPDNKNGKDDEVLGISGNPDILTIDYPGEDHIAIWIYAISGIDLIINDTGPIRADVEIPSDTVLVAVKAEGEWSIAITER